jgi:hypothetical protein
VLDQLEVEVQRTFEDQVGSGLTADDREDRHLNEVDKAGPISARFNDKLPWERSGT